MMIYYTVRGISVVFICNGETSKEFYYVNNARGISTSETYLLQYRASVFDYYDPQRFCANANLRGRWIKRTRIPPKRAEINAII